MVSLSIVPRGVNSSQKRVSPFQTVEFAVRLTSITEEESESEEEESEEEDASEPTPMDGLQTPSGLETPSGMASVVSTVAGGLETPDFLELRKNAGRAQSEAVDSGPRSLYQVVPEKQTSVRGLMGSERGYDVSAVANPGASLPVLGDERGTKVCPFSVLRGYVGPLTTPISVHSAKPMAWTSPSMHPNSKACPKRSFVGGTTSFRAVLRVYLVPTAGKTFRT